MEKVDKAYRKADDISAIVIADAAEILGRQDWVQDELNPTDYPVTLDIERKISEIHALFDVQRADLENYVEKSIERGVELREVHLAQCREKARVDSAQDDHRGEHGGGRMDTRKPVSFKYADVPKPETVAFNCEYTIWCNQKTKLQNYYHKATKPKVHAPTAQQGIFQAFMDARKNGS